MASFLKILVTTISFLFVGALNIKSQKCNYPSTFISFDNPVKTFYKDGISLKILGKERPRNDFGYATLNRVEYLIKDTSCVEFAFEFMFKANSGTTDMVICGGEVLKEKLSASPIHMSIKKQEIFTKLEYFENGKKRTIKRSLKLNGEGILSRDYYNNGWHHLVFYYSPEKQEAKIFIDGKTTQEFSFSLGNSKAYSSVLLKGSINRNEKTNALIDNIAFYLNRKININHLISHVKTIHDGAQTYDFCDSDLIYIAPFTISRDTIVDPNEYPLNYTDNKELDNVNSPLFQLQNFQSPRFANNHSMQRNFPWIDYAYLGGLGIGFTSRNKDALIGEALALQEELIINWNFGLQVILKKSGAKYDQAFNEFANTHPDIDAYMMINWHFTRPTMAVKGLSKTPYIKNTVLRNEYYHVESVNGIKKHYWNAGVNYEPIKLDGYAQLRGIENTLDVLKRPINMINENGEMGALHNGKLKNSPILKTINQDKRNYLSNEVTKIRSTYKEGVLSSPYLRNTAFSYYSVDGIGGHNGYKNKYDWKIIRNINQNNYSTPDFYPHSPYNWDVNFSFYHGISWIEDSRKVELEEGDKGFTPFVCAGWRSNPEKNMRPAQYLGLLKALGVLGAQYYYAAYFNNVAPERVVQNPKNYVWQIVMPSYAQGVMSHAENVLKNGNVLKNEQGAFVFSLRTNKINSYTCARELHNGDSSTFLITTSLQPRTNYRELDTTSHNKLVTIEKTGDLPQITIPTEYAGRTYILQHNRKNSEIVFYCLDNWHEQFHPERWSSNLFYEAELFDLSNTSSFKRKTVVTGETGEIEVKMMKELDFSSYTTFMRLTGNVTNEQVSPILGYNFQIRTSEKKGKPINLEVKLRSNNNSAKSRFGIRIINCKTNQLIFQKQFEQKIDSNWSWYNYSIPDFHLIDPRIAHRIEFEFFDNSLDLDKFVINLNGKPSFKAMKNLITWEKNITDFEVSKSCKNEIIIKDLSWYNKDLINISYTLAKNRWYLRKTGRKILIPTVHKKEKYFVTGFEKDSSNGWFTGNLNTPKFKLESYMDDRVFLKKEVFQDGKKIGKQIVKINLNKEPALNIFMEDTILCKGDSTIAKIVGNEQALNYKWSPSLYIFNNVGNAVVVKPLKSDYIVVSATDKNGCSSSDSVFVEVTQPEFQLDIEKHPIIYEGDKGPMNITYSITNGHPPFSISWDYDSNINTIIEKDNGIQVGNGKNGITDQVFDFTVSDNKGCSIRDFIFLEVKEKDKTE